MVQISKENFFNDVKPRDLLEATYRAIENFQVRAFFEAKDEILQVDKYSEEEFYEILDAMIDAETERRLVLDDLKGKEPLFLEEIVKIIKNFPPEKTIRDIIYIKEQGYIV